MGSQDESSLAARRARLRGSLAKQALPPDPYMQNSQNSSRGSGSDPSRTLPIAQPISGFPSAPQPESQAETIGEVPRANGAGTETARVPRAHYRAEDLATTQPMDVTSLVSEHEALHPTTASSASTLLGSTTHQGLFGEEETTPKLDSSTVANDASSFGSSDMFGYRHGASSTHLPSTSSSVGQNSVVSPESVGLGSLSESLKSLSRNSPDAPSSASIDDIADWTSLSSTELTSQTETADLAATSFSPMPTAPAAPESNDTMSFFGDQSGKSSLSADGPAPTIEVPVPAQAPVLEPPLAPVPAPAPALEPPQAPVPAPAPALEPPQAPVPATAPEPDALTEISAPVGDESRSKEPKAKKPSKSSKPSLEDDDTASSAQLLASGTTAPAPVTAVLDPAAASQLVDVLGKIERAMVLLTPPPVAPAPPADTTKTADLLRLLQNIDKTLAVCAGALSRLQAAASEQVDSVSACAMNLSAMQAASVQQTEGMRNLAETLQEQTFSELNLSISGLMENMTAALEPMQAAGELVPAIDQLVVALQSKLQAESEAPRLTPDQLVMNLADQLSNGLIDPWTFKSAYMAVFPSDHPADLLHRLVDLLGTSRLSGNLFRAAYDAVQAPDPPKRSPVFQNEDGTSTVVQVVQDENTMKQLEQLKKSQDELERKMSERETELNRMLLAKEDELKETKALLDSRFEESNARYGDLVESLQQRDEALKAKETELSRKESENSILRNQMDELKDMMSSLQKEFSASKAKADALSKPGFFDNAPNTSSSSLFDAAPARPLFQSDPSGGAPQQTTSQNNPPIPAPVPQPTLQQAPITQAPAVPPAPSPAQMQPPSQQAIPRQTPTTPFPGAGPGSYGSGVRAQVFEVIVRQALAGAPWREICAGPMQVNNITPEEVEQEVKRRQALLKK